MEEYVTLDQFREHGHRGYDQTSILSIRSFVNASLPGAQSQTAGNYGVFFIATRPCVIKQIKEVHSVAGTDASAVTLQIERLQGTESLGNGDELLSTAFNLKSTANTVQDGQLVSTGKVTGINAGDRLAFKKAGTLTSLEGVCVTIEIQYASL